MSSLDDTTLAQGYAALRSGYGQAVVDRDVIEVSGPEAEKFLQGQLSQDISAIVVGAAAWSYVLEPTGKVAALMRVVREPGDAYLLDIDSGFGEIVAARLNRFKLRTKADVSVLSGWVCGVNPLGDGPADRPLGAGGPVEESARVVSYRIGDVSYQLSERSDFEVDGLEPVNGAAYEAWRIEAGIPVMGAEFVPGETIPAEAGQWLIDAAVSFSKGCYTGQELVARIDSRGGNVPRHLRGLVIEAGRDDPPPAGAEVVVGEKVVGKITSVAWSPGFDKLVALAYVGRAVEPPADAVVRWASGTAAARVKALPINP